MYLISKKQTGFTLVELLVVMLILVAMASVTIETTSELAFQNRYEVTKDRYEKIKQAIIGRPDVLINGQPDISGFVADMGRLPNNIRELLDQNYCLVDRTVDETTSGTAEADCNAITAASWITQAANWQGPYLTISKSVTDAGAFPDGWGNAATADNDHNYGWKIEFWDTSNSVTTTEANYAHMIIQSKGKNATIGVADTGYDADYPLAGVLPSIQHNDWTVDINRIKANILSKYNPPTTTPYACDLSSVANGFVCKSAGWNWPGGYECSSSTYTDKTSCEANSELWEWQPVTKDACSDGGTVKASCTSPETWGECTSGIETTAQTSKNHCESNSGTWTFAPPLGLCIVITRNGNDYKTQPALPTIEENGNQRLIEFDNTYYDIDGDTTLDPGENLMPMGSVTITIHSPTCAGSAYRSVTAIDTLLYPKTTLPIINW